MKYGVRTKIQAIVGMQSLAGSGREPCPKSFGNYFSFWTSMEDFHNNIDIRCVNMWSENLEEAAKRFLKDGLIEGVLFTEERKDGRINRWFVVDDPRLPSKDWLYNKFCWTGSYVPRDKELLREMYSIHGDPTNEIEEFIDPKSYHTRHGAEYIELSNGRAVVKQTIPSNPKKLLDGWTIEIAQDLGTTFHPNLEEELTKIFAMEVAEEKGFSYAPNIPESSDNILSDPNFTEDDV